MKKIEKILKQKILINLEKDFLSYKMQSSSFNNSYSKKKTISKDQYRFLSVSNSVSGLLLKFPLVLSTDSTNENLYVNKSKSVVVPSTYLKSKNTFHLDSNDVAMLLSSINRGIFSLCYVIKSVQNSKD
jgi:hypothetical protein